MTPEELKQLAIGIRAGSIFTSNHLEDLTMMPTVFMPLALMSNDQLKKDLDQVGLIYEHTSKACPMGVNGYPCFMSFCSLKMEDTIALNEMIRKLEAAEKAVS